MDQASASGRPDALTARALGSPKPNPNPDRRVQGSSPDAASGSKAEVRFLIGVTSACCTAKSAGLRAGVRATWLAFMRQRYPDVDVRFIIAQPDSPNRRARARARAALPRAGLAPSAVKAWLARLW
jgi:hypothetical protein